LSYNKHRKVPMIDKIGYGAGNFSTGVSIQVVGAYLVFYSTAVLNIPGSLVGMAVSLSIVWDAFTDPLMGFISDETNSKTFGRRHLYLLIGALGIALSNYFLWNINTDHSTHTKFMMILAVILAVKSFMTVYITPYTALGAEMSNDYDERTSIQGIKTIFFLLGLAFVSVVGMYAFFQPSSEFPIGQLNPEAYSSMGLFSSAVVLVFALICFITTKKYIPLLNPPATNEAYKGKLMKLLKSFKGVLLNKSFRFVALAYMFNNISSALLSNIGLHVFTYTFMLNSQQIAIIIGVQFLFSMLSQPAWSVISGRIDKKPSMVLGLVICITASAIFLMLVFAKNFVLGNMLYFFPFAALAGFGTGGLFTLPLSMVADVIDLEELNTGKRAEGTYYGCLTLFYKFSQSFTLILIGFLLDLVKFDSNLPVQAEGTVITLGLILSIGSAISFVMALISIRKYSLSRQQIEEIQVEIKARNTHIGKGNYLNS
jgi:glycoside/pentoside/hexuronide:cation symporter, GPH family